MDAGPESIGVFENEYNVFLGRGYFLNNVRRRSKYRELIMQHYRAYQDCHTAASKHHFVQRNIIDCVRANGGSFFVWCKKSKTWKENSDFYFLYTKIAQALRDCKKTDRGCSTHFDKQHEPELLATADYHYTAANDTLTGVAGKVTPVTEQTTRRALLGQNAGVQTVLRAGSKGEIVPSPPTLENERSSTFSLLRLLEAEISCSEGGETRGPGTRITNSAETDEMYKIGENDRDTVQKGTSNQIGVSQETGKQLDSSLSSQASILGRLKNTAAQVSSLITTVESDHHSDGTTMNTVKAALQEAEESLNKAVSAWGLPA